MLCWLATASTENVPNVSPKECFNYYGDNQIIIANIASPQSVRNVKENENVCLSFIEVFVQKGFQIKGSAQIIEKGFAEFDEMYQTLNKMTNDKFPFSSITAITVQQVKPIIAPSYKLFPDITEASQIETSKKTYKV